MSIRPFRALRYNPAQVGDLSGVIAPPYDVISPAEQEALYGASPYNVVRLILGKQSAADTADDNRYTRAKRFFDDWRSQGILERDGEAALYVIEHAFAAEGRTHTRLGFIALLDLPPALERAVYRHEATLAAPKEDRTRLLGAVPANLEPIFCVYPDGEGAIHALLQAAAKRLPPAAEARLKGDGLRLWKVTDRDLLRTISDALAPSAPLIADGHHRFEVAYANRKRYGAVMSYFASMAEPSLVVRPIHRLVRGAGCVMPAALEGLCHVEPSEGLAPLLAWLGGQRGEGRFGYFDGRAFARVTIRPERLAAWLMGPTVPLPVAALDVSILHGLILPELGLNGSAVSYVADAGEAVKEAAGPDRGAVWLLRGIPLAQVYALAAQGFSLPPKSTYFYPKVPSGLVFNPHAD